MVSILYCDELGVVWKAPVIHLIGKDWTLSIRVRLFLAPSSKGAYHYARPYAIFAHPDLVIPSAVCILQTFLLDIQVVFLWGIQLVVPTLEVNSNSVSSYSHYARYAPYGRHLL